MSQDSTNVHDYESSGVCHASKSGRWLLTASLLPGMLRTEGTVAPLPSHCSSGPSLWPLVAVRCVPHVVLQEIRAKDEQRIQPFV